eukprot:NODE_5028_length_708_cov_23.079174_g4865_i0.p1 GENE.NODE_5028_length_708_cov_23.079174_g4865_i0~~NODE_5028_length_708_cov_23.079174_g4865_i0.p1  ORF type:complete len:184 (+),score=48.76 NODE_5028_length_708_cov_23.079174_g4865_i0:70-552(+)
MSALASWLKGDEVRSRSSTEPPSLVRPYSEEGVGSPRESLLPRRTSEPHELLSLRHRCTQLTLENDSLRRATRLPTEDTDLSALSVTELTQWLNQCWEGIRLLQSAQQDKINCCICFEHPKAVILMPCQHEATCAGCADRLETCPVCRTPITQSIKPFKT